MVPLAEEKRNEEASRLICKPGFGLDLTKLRPLARFRVATPESVAFAVLCR